MVDGLHFNTAFHSQLGLAIMILAYLQYIGGLTRPHKDEDSSDVSFPRRVFEFVHPMTGRLLLIAACVNIFAGINTWWPWWVDIVYAVTVTVFVLFIIFCELTGVGKDDSE